MTAPQNKWRKLMPTAVTAALLLATSGLATRSWAAGDAAATTKPATVTSGTVSPTEDLRAPIVTDERPEIAKLPTAPTMPKTVADLKAIQTRVEAVVKAALPAVVSIQFPNAQGSGVIVSKSGYILTAGHVSGTPGTKMRLVLADGRHLHGVSLGANNGIDSGMIKIVEKGDYPFVPVGSARNLVAGQWVVAMGHPGGFVIGRPPVVRLGRVLLASSRLIGTDSPLISGDSGGPLFDLDGRLIGINSRIGEATTENIHVPIDTFVDTWGRLAKGDEWGGLGGYFDFPRGVPAGSGAILGVKAFANDKGVLLKEIRDNTAAAHSGLLQGDIVTSFNGKPVKTPEDLAEAVNLKHPGDRITLGILRDSKPVEISVKLGSQRHRRGE